jgi:hypothetical protein
VRNEEADALAEEAMRWLEAGGDRLGGAASLLMWFSMGFLRSGRWSRAEELLERSGRYHLEGMMVMSFLSLRALLHWMQGRLEEASADVVALRETGPRSRYFRMLFPIEANIRADEGRVEELRRVAKTHLAADVGPMEESSKAATLHALVRAEIDAALEADEPARSDHLQRARTAVATIRDLVERFPPATLAGLQLDNGRVYLALAEAELTRATDPQPELWRALLERPWYVYWRVYARCRLGESLLAIGLPEQARVELDRTRQEAAQLNAPILRDEVDFVSRRAGDPSTPSSGPGSL